jgi:hypothetical protein
MLIFKGLRDKPEDTDTFFDGSDPSYTNQYFNVSNTGRVA